MTHDGIKYIMKDSWAQEDGLHNEVAHLRRMAPYEELKDRVPTLICGGDVVINYCYFPHRRINYLFQI